MQSAFPGGLQGRDDRALPAFPWGMRIIDAVTCGAMPPA